MRKIRLYIAMTLDGYIASRDGGVEWLDKYRNNTEDYGYTALYESIDTVLMGGNTYRAILGFGCEWPYPDKTSYVISHREQQGTIDHIRQCHFLYQTTESRHWQRHLAGRRWATYSAASRRKADR